MPKWNWPGRMAPDAFLSLICTDLWAMHRISKAPWSLDILALMVPSMAWAKRSLFLKIRDRQSYEFALASAAVALDIDDGRIRHARIALGGVSATPWRAREAEQKLTGRKLGDAVLSDAADAAFANAKPREHNAFKIQLGKLTLVRALNQAA